MIFFIIIAQFILTIFLYRRVNATAHHIASNQVKLAKAINEIAKHIDKLEKKNEQ